MLYFLKLLGQELLGLYITEHPFNDYKDKLKDIIVPLINLSVNMKGEYVNVSGVISNIKKIITRSNESMLFVKIEDSVSNTEVLVFPRLLKKAPDIWQAGKVVICSGKVSDKDQEIKILANTARELALDNMAKSIDLFKADKNGFKNGINNSRYYKSGNPPPAKQTISPEIKPELKSASLYLIFNRVLGAKEMSGLRDLFLKHRGSSRVILKINNDGQKNIIATEFMVNNSDELVNKISDNFKIGRASCRERV